jgi:membrane protein implicated in regulation of membrane protease activity
MLIPSIAFLWPAASLGAASGVIRFLFWTLTAALALGVTLYIVLLVLFAVLEYAMLPPSND